MATALDKTSGLGMAAGALMDLAGEAGPLLLATLLVVPVLFPLRGNVEESMSRSSIGSKRS